MFPTDTVSSGVWAKHFTQVSPWRYTMTSVRLSVLKFGFLKVTSASFFVHVRSTEGFSGCVSGLCHPSL